MVHLRRHRAPLLRHLLQVALVGVASALTTAAGATPVLVTFSGTFYDVSFGADAVIPPGTTYTAQLRYDTSTPGPINFAAGPGDFFDAQVGPYALHGTPGGYVVAASGQFFQTQATVTPGSIPLTDPVTIDLTISLVSGFFFDPNHLPDSFVGLPLIDRFFIVQGSGTAERAIATLSSITATLLPEPASLVVLGSACLLLGLARGRRARA